MQGAEVSCLFHLFCCLICLQCTRVYYATTTILYITRRAALSLLMYLVRPESVACDWTLTSLSLNHYLSKIFHRVSKPENKPQQNSCLHSRHTVPCFSSVLISIYMHHLFSVSVLHMLYTYGTLLSSTQHLHTVFPQLPSYSYLPSASDTGTCSVVNILHQ